MGWTPLPVTDPLCVAVGLDVKLYSSPKGNGGYFPAATVLLFVLVTSCFFSNGVAVILNGIVALGSVKQIKAKLNITAYIAIVR